MLWCSPARAPALHELLGLIIIICSSPPFPSLFLRARAKAQPLVALRATVTTSSRGANERLKRHQTDFPGWKPQGVTAAAANGCFDFQGGGGGRGEERDEGGGCVTSNRETSSSLRVVSRGLSKGTCENSGAHVDVFLPFLYSSPMVHPCLYCKNLIETGRKPLFPSGKSR